MDLKDIKAFIDLMKKNSIVELELETEGCKVRLKRGPNAGGLPAHYEDMPAGGVVPAMAPANAVPVAAVVPPPAQELEIKSPMIGTFYRAPSPESGPYVEVGSEVHAETVVCIIEAMKVMNEIKAELKGVVTQVLLENGKPVEFGQPLFKLRPA
jgi:acetyl-CoA carboxylase biotin carboxyl carrier protein